MEKNPFLVLGIHPDLVKRLNNEQLDALSARVYKALLEIFHPDKKGGSEKIAKEINAAKEKIDYKNNRKGFEQYKNEYIKRPPYQKKVDDFISHISLQKKMQSALSQNLLDFLLAISQTREYPNVFNLGPRELEMYDYLNWANSPDGRYKSWDMFKKFSYKLTIKPDGLIWKEHGGKTTIFEKKKLIGCITDDVLTKHFEGLFGLKRLLLNEAVDSLAIDEKSYRQKKEYAQMKLPEVITEKAFTRLLPVITPEVKQHYLLFSINQGENGGIYFALEGKIISKI
jgi:hypothetical protein